MDNSAWRERIKTLLWRFASIAMSADIAALVMIAALGLYCLVQAGG